MLTEDVPALWAEPSEALALSFGGIEGAVHFGETRASCVRVTSQYLKGTPIRNVRQLTLLGAEELAEIAADMGVGDLDPSRLGASVVVEGIPDFTHIPPSSRLQSQSGVTLTVDMLNLPCQIPAKSLELDHPEKGKQFKPAAKGRRGVTAWVERPGQLRIGDVLRLHVPTQRAWRP